MALWFPIYINDTRIGEVYIHRTEDLEEGRDEYRYDCEVQLEPGGGQPRRDMKMNITHNYSEGATVLIGKVMDTFNFDKRVTL